MMYPETFVEDKNALNAYQNEYGNFYEETTGFQRVCCIKDSAQYCPKCGCYHVETSSVKRCLCLTVFALMACIFFVLLTMSVTFHVEDIQGGYETVHHLMVLVSDHQNDDIGVTEPSETLSTNTESASVTTTEPPSVEDTAEVEVEDNAYDDPDDSQENYSYDERENRRVNEDANVYYARVKRSVKPDKDMNDEKAKRSIKKDEEMNEVKGGVIQDEEKHDGAKRSVVEGTDMYGEGVKRSEIGDEDKDDGGVKRSVIEDAFMYDEGVRRSAIEDADIVPMSRASDYSIPYIPNTSRTRYPHPPTGPDGSNYAESVKTSQQLTVANNQIWKPVCYRAQNSPNPSGYVCVPMISRQFDHPQYYHYTDSSNKECTNGNCNKGKGFDPSPTVVAPSTVPSSYNSDSNRQQPIIISPTNSPDIHIPTAISSPNPYFFPTFNGAPIMTHLPYDSRQIHPPWPYRGPPGLSPMYPPHPYGPPRFPTGYGYGYQPPLHPQPQFHMLPPQSPVDLQNPVLCMYVPSRSHQFPVVDGVTEVKNRNYEEPRQSQPPTNGSSHQTYRSGFKDCRADEFACKSSDSCIPMIKWCDSRVDCDDTSDETECSCKHRLSKHRLCDGYFDCPSGEDELGCFGCDMDSFSCQDWERGRDQSTCVPLARMCDNVVDCINHRDELECALLSDSIVPHKTHFVSYTRGILHRNWKGRWYPACTGPKVTEWAIQACLADTGPLSGEPHITMTSTEYPGPYIIPNGPDKYTLSQMCRDQKVVTYVTCPPIQCGTRTTRSLMDSSIRAREAQMQKSNSRSSANSENEETEDNFLKEHSQGLFKNVENISNQGSKDHGGYCEDCNSGARLKWDDWSGLIANKADNYRTQFEPVEEEYYRWTRDTDDILGVVGGTRSRPSSWPWVIALYKNGRFHCGGVIINEQWVMTAAHCMEQFSKYYFEVQAGMLRRFSFSPQEQTRRVTQVVVHSLYNTQEMQNDLALLKLDSKLKFNRWVRPICLPQEHISQYGPPPGSLCTAVGWGATEEGGRDPDDLHEVNVPILPYCKHRVDQEGAGLCAGYLHGGHDACQGDSGGPLLCKLPGDEDRWYVAGVVSHGEGCARPDEPGVYTRVFLFLDWIRSVVNDQGGSLFSSRLVPKQECPGQQCDSGRRCVPLSHLCDSKVDCLNAEDEISCNENYVQKSSISSRKDQNSSEDFHVEVEKHSTLLRAGSYEDQTSHEILRESNEYFMSQNHEHHTENLETLIKQGCKISDTEPTGSNASDEENGQDFPSTQDPWLQFENEGIVLGKNSSTERIVYENIESNDQISESQIKIHEPPRLDESATQIYEHSTGKSIVEESPVTEVSNFKPLQSKTLNKAKFEILPITEEPQQQLFSEGVDEYITEDFNEETENNDLGPKISIYKTTEQFYEHSTSPNHEFYTEDTTIEQKSVPETSNTTPWELEISTEAKSQALLTTEGSKYQLITEGANRYTTENIYKMTNGDEGSEVTDKNPFESSGSQPPDSHSTVDVSKEEYCTRKIHKTEQENSDIKKISSTNSDQSNSSLSHHINDSTTSTLPSLNNHETTIKTIMNYNYHKEDTRLIDEMVHQDQDVQDVHDSSKTEDQVDIHTFNIPPYLIPIIFPKTNIPDNNHSYDQQNTDDHRLKAEGLFFCKRYGQRLLMKRRCDGIVDCEDGSDERHCSCKERLVHLDKSLVCDGEVHCFDQSDEKNCTNECNKTEYFCPRSKVCIPEAKRCDRVRNCPENDDEENCYALMSDGEIRLDRGLVPELSFEGIVAVNSAHGWKTLCVGSKSGHSVAIRACAAIGFQAYDWFKTEVIKNETSTLHSKNGRKKTTVCYGLRVKCTSEKVSKSWVGQLLVEGEYRASVAIIHQQWFLIHSSICKQLHLQSEYAEISMGQNQVSRFGIRGVYEEQTRVDDAIALFNSRFCLLHTETSFNFSRQVRPIKFQILSETDFAHDFYAITLSDYGFRQLKLNRSKITHADEELCFTISHRPAECYMLGGFSENGFIIMKTLFESFVVSTFDSFQIFCDKITELCLQNISTFSSLIMDIIEKGNMNPKASPPCDGVRCGKCVGWASISDGEMDCLDETDESDEAFNQLQQACQRNSSVCGCNANQFRCPSGPCIDKSSYCDGIIDCNGGSDEPSGCRNSCLEFLRFAYPQKICDGVRNCLDKSDEEWNICHHKVCSRKDAFVCKSSGKCIPRDYLCDEEPDCPEGDDEHQCVSVLSYGQPEGTLSQQHFGVWGPQCLPETQMKEENDDKDVASDVNSDYSSYCSDFGKTEVVTSEIVSLNRTTLAIDSFSTLSLNNATSIIFRKGRPLVEIDSSSPCKYLYIKCL